MRQRINIRLLVVILAALFIIIPLFGGAAQRGDVVVTPEAVLEENFAHEDFARIIFRISEPGRFDVNVSGDMLMLRFDRPVSIDFRELLVTLRNHVISASLKDDRREVVFKLKSRNMRVRRFIGQDFIGIDLITRENRFLAAARLDKPLPDESEDDAQEAPVLPPIAQPQEQQELAQLVIDKIGDDAGEIYGPPPPPHGPPLPPPPEVMAAIREMMRDSKEGEQTEERRRYSRKTAAGLPILPVSYERITEPGGDVRVIGGRIIFDFRKTGNPYPVAATVFARNGTLWAFFDAPYVLDFGSLDSLTFIDDVQQIFHPRYSIMRAQINPEYSTHFIPPEMAAQQRPQLLNITAYDEISVEDMSLHDFSPDMTGSKWNIELKHAAEDAHSATLVAKPLAIVTGPSEEGPKLWMDIPNFVSNYRMVRKRVMENLHKEKPEGETQQDGVINITKLEERLLNSVNFTIHPLEIVDPVMGDRLVIIPLDESQTGIAPSRGFVDFSLPTTAQGIVMEERSDDIIYRILDDGVEVLSMRRLYLSEELFGSGDEGHLVTLKEAPRTLSDLLPHGSVFPFVKKGEKELDIFDEIDAEKEKTADDSMLLEEATESVGDKLIDSDDEDPFAQDGWDYSTKRRELFHALINAPRDARSLHRLNLAEFFFKEGMCVEALGMTKILREKDPTYDNMQKVDLIDAACLYLTGEYGQARDMFSRLAREAKGHASYAELSFWHWASEFQIAVEGMHKTKPVLDADFVQYHDSFMSEYPNRLRIGFGLLAAQDKLEQGDPATAKTLLSIVLYATPKSVMPHEKTFFKALVEYEDGDHEEALKGWQEIADDHSERYWRARAMFEILKHKLLYSRISLSEAIEQLDNLRSIWRGDALEIRILKMAGHLHIKAGDYVAGLRSWQELVQGFPGTKDALLIAGKMKESFTELFTEGGKAYDLEPFDALSLYFEFRELTPIGKRGDDIVVALVDHFVDADLLDSAAALIEHQIRFRSAGRARQELALRLADIYLADRQPDMALKSLDYIAESGDVDEHMAEERKQLKARALIENGEYDKVISLLEGDPDPEARGVRITALRKAEKWGELIREAEPRINIIRASRNMLASIEAEKDEEGEFTLPPLDEKDTRDAINLGLAYATTRDLYKNISLRNEFLDKVEDEEKHMLFDFISHEVPHLDHEDLTQTTQLDDTARFMNEYIYWPGKKWQQVISMLSPLVEPLQKARKPDLSAQQRREVLKLAIAYYELLKQIPTYEEEKQAELAAKEAEEEYMPELRRKDVEKEFKTLVRSFPMFKIEQEDISLLRVFDERFTPKDHAEPLQEPVPLKDIGKLIDAYIPSASTAQMNITLYPPAPEPEKTEETAAETDTGEEEQSPQEEAE